MNCCFFWDLGWNVDYGLWIFLWSCQTCGLWIVFFWGGESRLECGLWIVLVFLLGSCLRCGAKTPEKPESTIHIPAKTPEKNTIHIPGKTTEKSTIHIPAKIPEKNTIHNPHSRTTRPRFAPKTRSQHTYELHLSRQAI